MKWSTLLGLSVHDKSLPFDRTCCLDKSELETCLRFLVSCNRSHKQQQWESFFLVPRPPTVQFDVVHQLLDLRHKQHLIFCAQHVLHLHVLLDSRDSSGSFLLWEPLLPMVLRLHRVPLDVFTGIQSVQCRHNVCQIHVQLFRQTSERSALPRSFPGC